MPASIRCNRTDLCFRVTFGYCNKNGDLAIQENPSFSGAPSA